MFRIFLTALLMLFNFAMSKDLQGKIQYTENTARIEAFRDLARQVPKNIFKDYLKDKNYKENYKSVKKGIYVIDKEPKRNVNPFYVLNTLALYSVQYEDDINKIYYYNALGHLVKFEINDCSSEFPYRSVAYDTKGEVMNISLTVSLEESFIFNKNEELLGHWVGNEFYGKKGKKHFKRILE